MECNAFGVKRRRSSTSATEAASVVKIAARARKYLTRSKWKDLPQLAKLPFLRELDLTGQKVTAEGVAKLKEALPHCNITWNGNGGDDTTAED